MNLPLCLLCAVVACGCQPAGTSSVLPANPSGGGQKLTADGKPWSDFKSVPEPSVSEQLAELKRQVHELEMARLRAWTTELGKTQAALDPNAKGYTVIETSLGRLLLADTEVTPYLDGYSVRFKIGNLLSAHFSGCKITARWGPPSDTSTNNTLAAEAAYAKRWRTSNFDIPDVFYSGMWTPLELKIVPADSASIRSLRIELQPTTVNMNEVKK